MRRARTFLFHAAAALAFGLGLGACRGPDPVVRSHELRLPESEGAPHRVVALIENRGGGEGHVEVVARLRSRATGQTAAEREETVELSPREALHMTLELRPALPGPYDLTVEATYPP